MSDMQDSRDAADLHALRLPQDFETNLGVEKVLVHVPVCKPYGQWFVRTRPGDDWRTDIAAIVRKGQTSEEVYVVNPALAPSLPLDVRRFRLMLAISRQGQTFLWKLRHPNSAADAWALSALQAAALAEHEWVRVFANNGAYDVRRATAAIPEPEWPKQSFEEIFRLAFRDRVIETVDHPVLRELEGAL